MKIVKERNNYYLLKDNQKIKIEPEVVQKYKIYYELDQPDFKIIYQENEYYIYYKMAIKRLSRMQSELMLRKHLDSKGASKSIINQVIVTLNKFGYLNDYEYAKNYKDLKMYSYGPLKITSNLLKDGVSKEIVDDIVATIDEESVLTDLIQKDLLKIKSSIYNYQQKLIRRYYQKGFNLELIKSVINKELKDLNYDESIDLEKEYQKLINRPNKKNIDQSKWQYQVRMKLLKKGYRLDDIKKIEER